MWIAGTVVLAVGVGMIHTGRAAGEPLAAISSLVLTADMAFFGWLVLRRNSPRPVPRVAAAE